MNIFLYIYSVLTKTLQEIIPKGEPRSLQSSIMFATVSLEGSCLKRLLSLPTVTNEFCDRSLQNLKVYFCYHIFVVLSFFFMRWLIIFPSSPNILQIGKQMYFLMDQNFNQFFFLIDRNNYLSRQRVHLTKQ